MTSLFFRLASIAGLGSLLVAAGGETVGRTVVPQPALSAFAERTAAYAALHRRLEYSLPVLEPSHSMQALYQQRARLAATIKAARPHARQGDFFTPEVVDVFHRIIAKALSGVDSEALLRDLYEEQAVVPGFRPRVHEAYPEWATHEVPIVLIERLPLLPEVLQYRLIDHALILWDVDADLIIDVLFDAIPSPTS